jgi:hypothetical protein
MHYCMNKEELAQFIDFEYSGKQVQSKELSKLIESSQSWQDELGFMNYLFAKVLSKKVKQKFDNCSGLIALLNPLQEQMYIQIHQCDHIFVDYMIRFNRDRNVPLEEQLIQFHNHMREYKYG